MSLAGKAVGLLLGLVFFSSTALAEFSCEALLVGERPVTAKILRDKSSREQLLWQKKVPAPGYDDLKAQSKIQQAGAPGYRALNEVFSGIYPKQDMSKPGAVSYSFVGAPSTSTPDPIAVKLFEEGRTKAVHIDTNFNGRKHATNAIVSLPQPKILNDGPYLIGKEYKTVLVHLHGGGTPTAEAANGDSIAKAMGKRGIPVFALGLGGHGGSTRDPNGLETFDKQAEWVLQILENMIDPNVKIIISGHSWGAMFAVHMRRMALNPKYTERIKRISQFIALSPPVDVSLCGDHRKQMEFEREFEKNIDQHRKKIAPGDYEFQKNVLSNGKDSDIGGTFLQLTSMDYNTRPLTAEEEAKLAPETVIIGHADSLYVGREEQFANAFGKNLTVLGAGRTFKSNPNKPEELTPTGHQLFDLYIPGTTKALVYTKMADLILEGGPDWPISETVPDKAANVAEKLTHYFSNFFGFRELLKMPYYQTLMSMDKSALSKRRSALAAYVGKLKPILNEIETLENADPKLKEKAGTFPAAQKAIENLRTSLGIKGNINNVERAKEEKNLPELTEARAAALRAYVDEVKRVEADLKVNFKDAIHEFNIQRLNKEYARILQLLNIDSVELYESKMKDYPPKVKLDKQGEEIRSALGRLQQEMIAVTKEHKGNFGIARAAKVTAIATPEGITDVRSANRELDADRSPEQIKRLDDFIARFDEELEKARVSALTAAHAKLKNERKPEGVSDPMAARRELEEVESRLEYTYIPEGHREIGIIARQIKAYLKDVDVLIKGPTKTPEQLAEETQQEGKEKKATRDLSLKGLEKTVDDIRRKRADQLEQFEKFWEEKEDGPPPFISSPLVTGAKKTLDATYEAYGQMYINYQSKKGDWLQQLKDEGRLTGDVIIASTKELEGLRLGVIKAKATYMKTRESFERIRWTEAIKGQGHIFGNEEDVRKAKEIARNIWGDDYTTTGVAGPNSLNRLIRDEEQFLTTRQAQLSLKERQIEMLKVEYAARMKAIGEPLPGTGHRLDLTKPLELSIHEFLNLLDRDPVYYDAYVGVIKQWESYLAKLRSDNQTNKDSGAY